jgi:hypothetical protein
MSQTKENSPPSGTFGKKAAGFSILTALVAIGLNVAGVTITVRSSIGRFTFTGAGMAILWVGLLSAITGLIQGIRIRGKGTVWCALAGLILNAGVLSLAFIDIPAFAVIAGRSGRATLVQLNAIPQVFRDSFPIFDPDYGFRLELPKGFVKNPAGKPAPMVIHSYVRYDAGGAPHIMVNISRLRGILAPKNGKLSTRQLEEFKQGLRKNTPNAVLLKVEQEQWKSHTLDVFLIEMPHQGQTMRVWSVHVPLAGEAIQIQVGGTMDVEDQCRQVLVHLLKSLQGNSNWD